WAKSRPFQSGDDCLACERVSSRVVSESGTFPCQISTSYFEFLDARSPSCLWFHRVQMACDRFLDSFADLSQSFALREATRQGRHLGPIAAFFCLVDDHAYFHGWFTLLSVSRPRRHAPTADADCRPLALCSPAQYRQETAHWFQAKEAQPRASVSDLW